MPSGSKDEQRRALTGCEAIQLVHRISLELDGAGIETGIFAPELACQCVQPCLHRCVQLRLQVRRKATELRIDDVGKEERCVET